MGFKHSHSLGQNFLTDKNLLAAIVGDAGVTASDRVIEVGAGQGALTRPLAATGARVTSYEIDSRLEEYLRPLESEYPALEVVMSDFMKAELPGEPYKAVANLPYYITTPVLFRFLDDPDCESVTVMVQKEVAERIIAPRAARTTACCRSPRAWWASRTSPAAFRARCSRPRPTSTARS